MFFGICLAWQESAKVHKRPASSTPSTPCGSDGSKSSMHKLTRFGKLSNEHYPVLDKLPKLGLPDFPPPKGEHQYTLWMSTYVRITVKLRGKQMVLCHVGNNRSQNFSFSSEKDVAQVWAEVYNMSHKWIKAPAWYCPRWLKPTDEQPEGVSGSPGYALWWCRCLGRRCQWQW